jgi:ATP-binding cassette subfamily F protein uup
LWREYEGGVQDWLIQSKRSRDSQATSNSFAVNTIKTAAKAALDVKSVAIKSAPSTKKRSNKEQREFDSLPARIEALEQEQAALRAELAGVNLYAKDPQRASAICQRDAAIDEEMLTALARWEALASN